MAQGLPKQGARALIKSWGDANAEMMKKSNKKATQSAKKAPKKAK